MKERHRLLKLQEEMDDTSWEKQMEESGHSRRLIDMESKERDKARKRRRMEEKKKEELPLLEFIRQVVELTMKEYSRDQDDTTRRMVTIRASLTATALDVVRYDGGAHLIKLSDIVGVCKHCKKRSRFRCVCCKVALHAECFFDFHTTV